MKNQEIQLSFYLLFLALLPLSTLARPIVLVLTQDDLSDPTATHNLSSLDDFVVNSSDFDDFPDFESRIDSVIDPGSWSPVLESEMDESNNALINSELIYYSVVRLMVEAASRGEYRLIEEAVSEIDATSTGGDPHAQSVMGFFYNTGMTREKNKAKGFLYHYFAAQGGNMQSKMALAYTYYSQEVSFEISAA
ncbi:unnamed protein product [Fraxinus pennsylvanica]|uniref:Sel1 repeat family protein n=1 Tax=Fraxinus pennsylvanica TaxID=56036 RepID=A0AAD1YY84_9LAMI|nr:unnamed protein product [Fraxinus pennsylvanica]